MTHSPGAGAPAKDPRNPLGGLLRRHRVLAGCVGAALAAALAVTWAFVIPAEAQDADGVRWLALRWGHSACWALLALAAALFAARAPRRAVDVAAWAGLACYVAFLAALAL
ncbi:hypothetical protein [Thalassiella azotivora]